MTATITLVLALLAATVVCASLATHLRVPYAIVLVLAGAGLSPIPGLPSAELSPI
jgi:Kef-type K+ transport system membrane component KefB